MFSLNVPLAIATSCGTYATAPGHVVIASMGGSPEIVTLPFAGGRIPSKISTMVVLPAPDGPTNATNAPLVISSDTSRTAGSALPG
ncbi:unannotated protein [freshwater metagenome]|uniref:Unannotated protein n=1 Tax=freshwater metagenome TaxID=449393 RepID=A0A6J6WM09_9ZZZZ